MGSIVKMVQENVTDIYVKSLEIGSNAEEVKKRSFLF
jgi:hypothetical protein